MTNFIKKVVHIDMKLIEVISKAGLDLEQVINQALVDYLSNINLITQKTSIEGQENLKKDIKKYVSGLEERVRWREEIEE